MPVGKRPENTVAGLPDIHYNPLQQYRNPTYNVRFTMMPASDAVRVTNSKNFNYTTGLVMFETGGTGTINMEELTMKILPAGNATGNYMVTQPVIYTMKLVEPIGGRFIESLSLAAYKLGYVQNQDAVYLLEVSFVGYDDDDQPVTCKDWDGAEMTYRWYVSIGQLRTQIDYRGATYDLELMRADGRGLLGDFMNLEQGFRMTGNPSTVGDLCRQLEEALNKREKEKVEAGLRQYPHKYKISAHKKMKDLKYDYGFFDRGNWSWAIGKGETQIEAGTTIPNFITNSLPNSKDMMKFLHKVNEGKKKFNDPDTLPNTLGILSEHIAILVGSVPQSQGEDILFDEKLNAPAEEINIFITTQPGSKNIISPREYIDAYSAAQRNDRVQEWIKLGLLRKAYRWIHTGENTEVITANIKIDNLWRIVRPLWIDTETGKPVAPSSTQPPSSKRNPAAQNSNLSAEEARQVRNKEFKGGEATYAEDMPYRAGQEQDSSPHLRWKPQFYHANTQVQQKQAQAGWMQESGHEYSVFRQIHNSIGASSADLSQLDLEVVGDPYYLCQIPTKQGEAPWEENVWEWEKNHWTDEELGIPRRKTSSQTNMPYVWFEAVLPAANLNKDDLMDLRSNDAITGIYAVKEVVNTFSKGKFTSRLATFRDNLMNPWSLREAKAREDAKKTGSGSANATGPQSSAPSSSRSSGDTGSGESNIGTLGA
jgi:hypothetical protein